MSTDSYLSALAEKLARAKFVKVGFLEGATETDGTSVPMIAAIQNYGAPEAGIPPRPFFTDMVKQKSTQWGEQLKAALRFADYDSSDALKVMGEHIKADLQQAITDMNEPALSPVTVMLRGMRSKGVHVTGKTVGEAARRVEEGKTNYGASAKPLVDTGTMRNDVDYEVE